MCRSGGAVAASLAWCWQPGYRSRVAAKSALNAKNLEALGLERLAALLIEISAGNAAAKRRLRMELAGAQSSAELARAVRKRLTIIARSGSFVDWCPASAPMRQKERVEVGRISDPS